MRTPESPAPPERPAPAEPRRTSRSPGRRPAMLPWLILGPLVAALLVTVIVLLSIRPQPAPTSQVAPTATAAPAVTPARAPAITPAPSPASNPSPSPITNSERQQRYRAYVSTVLIDGASLVAATAGLQNCVSNRRETCKKALSNARGQVATFQKDLDANPTPSCMDDADPQLRAGLAFYERGIELAQQGVNERNRLHMVQGLLLIGAATWRTGQAVRTARSSAC